MKINQIPENIGTYLKYDETSRTGLRWVKKFCKKINVGDEAGSLNKPGYYKTMFQGKLYLNHRIIFFLRHGYCPACVDHIDNISTNNKIANLREATRSQNNQNSKINKKLKDILGEKLAFNYLVNNKNGTYKVKLPNNKIEIF